MFYPLPDTSTIEERLAQFPAGSLPVKKPVEIYWNEYQIPFIMAETDDDGAFAMGLVHAHLRLGQLEVAKRMARGRLSEMFGPFTNNLDIALRTLGIARCADEVLAKMPAETRLWIDHYVDGLNYYKNHLKKGDKPHEFHVLSIGDEAWTAADSIAIGRIFGGDVNWLGWFDLLPMSEQEDFSRIWAYMHEVGSTGAVSFENIESKEPKTRQLRKVLQDSTRSGSNSIVLSKHKSATGAGLIANDPHLGMMMPNAWMMAGLKCPSYHIVGMQPPGIPAFGFGRTPHIAWGGTNMRALSSDLVDVTNLPDEQFTTEEHLIKTRFWMDKKAKTRISPYGPVISDSPVFPSMRTKRDVAVRWIGHQFSDEITALLKASQAKEWTEFVKAMDTFSIPAQNFLYTDTKGNIGHVLATMLPKRTKNHRENLVQSTKESDLGWKTILTASTLPKSYNPKEGYLASANNRPTTTKDFPIGYFFPQDERIRRLHQILSADKKFTIDDLEDLQRDTISLTSFELKNGIVAKFEKLDGRLGMRTGAVFDFIKEWDGSYAPHSKGAYVFTAFIIDFAPNFYEAINRVEEYEIFKNDAYFRDLMRRALPEIKDEDFVRIVQRALKAAYKYFKNNNRWGSIHHLEVQHFLGRLPVLGRRYRKYTRSYGGTRETVMKAAHPLTMDKHRVYYGAQSRQISDMSDMDANYFVLVGGNDGWINSQNFSDQIDLWVRGEYIHMPLKPETVRRKFRRRISLYPQKN